MAASSYQQRNSFLLDQTSFFPNHNTTTTTTTTTTNTSFPQIYQHHDHLASFNGPHYDQVYGAKKLQTPDSSMSVVLDDQKADIIKDTSNRLKKQKKANDYQEEKKKKNTKKGSCEEEIGYIHVRARRGQATDSHSLAERVRREKISEKMKLLQSIVPGCDKVTGKALMLDEIITYVQSLQNQVEFLSMKLASVNPMLYDFGMDLDAFMLKPDENMSSMVLPIMPSVQESSPNVGAATFTLATDNYYRLPHMIDVSTTTTNSLLFQQSQMPSNILSQGNGQQMWDVDEQRLKVDNPFALSNNVTTFH